MNPLKGNAVVAQSGGCTAVINQSLAGVIDAARRSKAITKILGAEHAVEGMLNNCWIHLNSQPASLLRQIRNLPSAALGSSRYKLKAGEECRVLEQLKKNNVRYLFMIGGNDTAETILRIAHAAEEIKYELRAVHVPKTIDNDLMETDHTPGYGSVARFAAISTQETGLDTQAMRRVDPIRIIELMGRNSGWVTASAALLKKKESDPPHLIWIPEVPFEESIFLNRVDQILKRVGYCVMVISETIRDKKGKLIGARQNGAKKDPFGHPFVEGTAAYLAQLIERHFKIRARFDKPGTIQRMSMAYVSKVDQKEAYQAGAQAVRWAIQGTSKVMVGFKRLKQKSYRIEYFPIALAKIAGKERYMPSEFLSPDKTSITQKFISYALPLLGKNLPAFPTFK